MEEVYKILMADAATLSSRIRQVNPIDFLRFVKENGSIDDFEIIELLVGLSNRGRERSIKEPSRNEKRERDIYAREIRAILSDNEFLPTKGDLLILLSAVVGEVPAGLAKKSGRDSVVDWAVRHISESPAAERQSRYRAIRQIFLRKRDSSLKDWAEILSKSSR